MPLAVILILLFTAGLLPAQTGPCETRLIQPAQNPFGNRLRGNRCEGIYVQEVSGEPLLVASWTESFPQSALAPGQPVKIAWDAFPGAAAVRLRAQALRHRLYYRMDALQLSGKLFLWPSDLLSGLNISPKDVGVIGTARGLVDNAQRDIYLPLRVSQGDGAGYNKSYQLVLLPGVELKEVFLTLTAVDGNKSTVLKNAEPLGYGYYPAERPVAIAVSGPRARGFYHLEIGATGKAGGNSTAELWFYQAAN